MLGEYSEQTGLCALFGPGMPRSLWRAAHASPELPVQWRAFEITRRMVG